jgi:copper(I)-binding protein
MCTLLSGFHTEHSSLLERPLLPGSFKSFRLRETTRIRVRWGDSAPPAKCRGARWRGTTANHEPNGPVASAWHSATVVLMHSRLRLLSVAVATLVALAACSGTASAPTIAQAWARPAPVGGNTAAYLTITTGAGQADALLSASSPGADMVQVHEVSTDASGMTGMHPIDRLDIPAGTTVSLEPGGHHLMVMGVTSELAVGGKLELDLVFEHAGKVVVQAEIRQG